MYDYSELQARMFKKGYSQRKLAQVLGKTEGTISSRFNHKSFFRADEMDSICELLDIPAEEIHIYFFTK